LAGLDLPRVSFSALLKLEASVNGRDDSGEARKKKRLPDGVAGIRLACSGILEGMVLKA